jgi:uncharacterized protein with NAD-binding domain and iron-sulfur cluster
VVISFAPDRSEVLTEVIAEQALDDIRRRLKEARRAEVIYKKVVRTARATVLLKPGSERLRPPPRTPIRGLFLAGDWCATGLPATIESAARSGLEAAKAALKAN